MHHGLKLHDKEYEVELSRARDGYRLHVGDRTIALTLQKGRDGQWTLTAEGAADPVLIATHGDDVFIHLDGASYHVQYEHPLERLAHQAHGAAEDGLRAPMPGSLVVVHVKTGQKVAKGEALLVMESMKMETTLAAARDGVVAAVHFAPGQTFDRDAVLLTLEPEVPQ